MVNLFYSIMSLQPSSVFNTHTHNKRSRPPKVTNQAESEIYKKSKWDYILCWCCRRVWEEEVRKVDSFIICSRVNWILGESSKKKKHSGELLQGREGETVPGLFQGNGRCCVMCCWGWLNISILLSCPDQLKCQRLQWIWLCACSSKYRKYLYIYLSHSKLLERQTCHFLLFKLNTILPEWRAHRSAQWPPHPQSDWAPSPG